MEIILVIFIVLGILKVITGIFGDYSEKDFTTDLYMGMYDDDDEF